MNKIELLDGTVLENVKLSLTFSIDYEESTNDIVEVHIEGLVLKANGWYSNVVRLQDLSSIFCEDDLVRVKFALAKMNSSLKIK